MTMREDYERRLQAQLAEWKVELDRLWAKAKEAQADAANRLREIREQSRRNADREAKKIIALAIQRIAAEQTVETTVSTVALPNDEMKGRIIGREGRNIRAFELATGVDVIIDDTPDTVVVSCFEPMRRETARLALEKLVADGRIHPGRIEEVVNKSREEATRIMYHVHQKGVGECGIYPYEVAETKVARVMDTARRNQHPLQCVMEKQ